MTVASRMDGTTRTPATAAVMVAIALAGLLLASLAVHGHPSPSPDCRREAERHERTPDDLWVFAHHCAMADPKETSTRRDGTSGHR